MHAQPLSLMEPWEVSKGGSSRLTLEWTNERDRIQEREREREKRIKKEQEGGGGCLINRLRQVPGHTTNTGKTK